MEHPSGESRFEKLLFEKTQMLRQDSTAKQSAASMSLGSADSALDSEKVPTEQVSSMKRPSSDLADDIHCTCAISSQCELAAKNGLRDCRTLVAPKRRKVTKPRLPYDTSARFISTKEKGRIQRSNDEVLYILSLLKRSLTANVRDLPGIFQRMRDRVHQLPFYEISNSENLLKRFLDQESGLPAIINSNTIPWDIRLDAEMLYLRWEKQDLDPSLLRGIEVRRRANGENSSGMSRKISGGYQFKRVSSFVGEGDLRNGQWFPWQLSAVRDGAHGELEAGISGRQGLGAVSIVLSSSGQKQKSAYADIDEGDLISYCGTRGKNFIVSSGTKLLLESAKNTSPIRVLRSSKLGTINKYRPSSGLRYDGLYEIYDKELLEEATMLYRFKLRRMPGQTPIRFQGVEMRPNNHEVNEWDKVQNLISKSRFEK